MWENFKRSFFPCRAGWGCVCRVSPGVRALLVAGAEMTRSVWEGDAEDEGTARNGLWGGPEMWPQAGRGP